MKSESSRESINASQSLSEQIVQNKLKDEI